MAGEVGLVVKPTVAIIGGGLAGLAAATALAARGFRVTILESRQRLGGRAGSFTDPATGQLVDACQHVSMGVCTNFAHFCRTVGIDHFLAPQPRLTFVTPDGRRSVFKADPWPAPFHLGRALLGAHYLTPLDKLRVVWGLLAMLRESPDADPPLLDWLKSHRQNQRTIDRFWGVVLVSALNETIDRVGLKYARKVFVEGFLRHREGFVVHLPTVPLGRFYGEELHAWLSGHGVDLRENAGVREIARSLALSTPRSHALRGNASSPLRGEGVGGSKTTQSVEEGTPAQSVGTRNVESAGSVSHLLLRDGSTLTADWYILAVPHERAADLLPEEVAPGVKQLEVSPITSVHLWYDRPVLRLPHAVLVDCLGHWVFNRDESNPGEHYLQVVISAARHLQGLGREEVRDRIAAELARLFPKVREAKLLRAKVVTEHTATFSAVPGVDRRRPPQETAIPNLVLAGDWTQTGWPATMEGAVRSGYLAAEVILRRCGRPESIVRADLGDGR